MRQQSLAVLVLLALSLQATTQTIRRPVGVVYTQVACCSRQQADAFSFASNPAALPNVRGLTAGVYGERRFTLQDLGQYTAVVVAPTSSGAFGAAVDYFGSVSYHESQLGLAYGRSLGEKMALGVQFNYYAVAVPGYGSAGAVTFDGGALFRISEGFSLGIQAHNPTAAKLGKNDEERLASTYSAGLGYDLSQNFYLGTEVEKEENLPLQLKTGVQYRFDKRLLARAGITTGTRLYYFGIGVFISSFRIDATASVHPQLGLTPGILLIFNPIKQP